MNISSSTASFASQASSNSSRAPGPPPRVEDQLASALKTIGVDDSTSANVLEQVGESLSAMQSQSSSGRPSREAVQSAVSDVLEANGIDSAKVEEAIAARGPSRSGGASRSGGPSGAGRPNGPPPPPKKEESETSAVESALVSAGVDESSTDELISQIIDTIGELTTESGSNVSQDELRTVLTNLFEENGVDFSAFEQALASEIGSAGSFLDVLV
ncbi:hypothetical protein [Neorhodopirellula pilleata]|uniref:Uncharacterized protein n=1 Tax=Neorhodopirellula pilleata TaxID=2714738 RepID=A0A5C6ATU2_9BACT|nr:hypothetical protein [Neorhodopirellula pilleata]TWU03415.1 hypothetical protein Pla100_03360 [Neorhodopirellula pilleata]